MDRDKDIYCACLLLFSASEFLFKHDEKFSNFLLDKTNEMMKSIKIDENLINEVKSYATQIKEGSDES